VVERAFCELASCSTSSPSTLPLLPFSSSEGVNAVGESAVTGELWLCTCICASELVKAGECARDLCDWDCDRDWEGRRELRETRDASRLLTEMSLGGVVLGVVEAWEPVPERVSEGVRGRRRVGRRGGGAEGDVLVADYS
jgi:hypothetical protein